MTKAKIHEAMDHIATTSGHVVQQQTDYPLTFSSLPLDVIILIFDHLPVNEVLKLECLSRHLQMLVSMHLKVRKSIDLCISSHSCNTSYILGDTLRKGKHKIKSSKCVHSNTKHFPDITDNQFRKLLERMPTLQYIYNLSPDLIDSRRCLFGGRMSVEGVTRALAWHPRLLGVQINNICLLEMVLERLPNLKVLGCFRKKGRNAVSPEGFGLNIELPLSDRVTQIYLEDCYLETLPEFGTQLKSLILRNLKFSDRNPFLDLDSPRLERFIMTGCDFTFRMMCHVELLITLCQCQRLNYLELQLNYALEVDMLTNLIERYEYENPFSSIHTLILDLKSRDSVLKLIETSLARLETLHLDRYSFRDERMKIMKMMLHSKTSRLKHLKLGWYPERHQGAKRIYQCKLSEKGLQDLVQCFPLLETLEIENQHFCKNLFLWQPVFLYPEFCSFLHLRALTLSNCYNIDGSGLAQYIQGLPGLQRLTMVNVGLKPVNQATSQVTAMESVSKEGYCAENEKGSTKVGEKRHNSTLQLDDGTAIKRKKIQPDGFADMKRNKLDKEMQYGGKRKINFIHPRLQTLHLTNVDISSLELSFSQLRTLHLSQCVHLGFVTFTNGPDLPLDLRTNKNDLPLDQTTVDVANMHHATSDLSGKDTMHGLMGIQLCGCPLVNEVDLIGSISRLHPGRSLFVHLTPKHKMNIESFCEAVWSKHHGHVFVFDYNADPSGTEYNSTQAESWLPLLDHLTKSTQRDFQNKCDLTGATEKQRSVYKLAGESEKGSQWMLITDVPWFKLLTECPDVEMKTAVKGGMYCREAKGHRNAEEVYNNLKDHIDTEEGHRATWFRHTVITYVNMCGTDSESFAETSSEKHL